MTMTRKQMLDKLAVAQHYMAEVYKFACDNNIHALEQSLSYADTGIMEALDYIREDEHELLVNDAIIQVVADVQNGDLNAIGELLSKAPKNVLQSYLSEV